MFASRIAGPSRLPFSALLAQPSRAAARAYASVPDSSSPAEPSTPLEAAAESSDLLDDVDAPFSFGADKRGQRDVRPGAVSGYHDWLGQVGGRFASVPKGEKARWLGGDVPYASNPSFRPPPPLSNDLMDALDADLRKAGATTGDVAQRWNVSKARLRAVRRLKEVEREFARQSIPLQHAYQSNMETLLGALPLTTTNAANAERAKVAEATARGAHPSTLAEQDEEARLDRGVGAGGAFGRPDAAHDGVELDVWEFREEGAAAEKAEAAAVASDAKERAERVEHAQEAVRETKRAVKSKAVNVGKAVYRFVDTSNVREKTKA
ncbi:hypothetical protein Q5752_001682 [Cryptotrichosporon argae]